MKTYTDKTSILHWASSLWVKVRKQMVLLIFYWKINLNSIRKQHSKHSQIFKIHNQNMLGRHPLAPKHILV